MCHSAQPKSQRKNAKTRRYIGTTKAGAVTLVARGNHVVFFEATGMVDVEAGDVMKKDSIFRIRSMTKPIVSLAVLMLYEEIGIHPGYGFGLGVAVRQASGGVVLGSEGEYTSGGIDNTVFWVDPEENLILIFMTNSTPYDLYQRWYFKTAVYQAIVE